MAIAPSAGPTDSQKGVDAAADTHVWPSAPAAYYGLTVIIIATFLTFFDQTVFSMLAERIKIDFGLTDEQLGLLGGPASIIFYVFVGIPLARLVDIYPRKIILACNAVLVGLATAAGGIAQNFGHFFATRMFLGAGGATHGPASYSLITDMFRPFRIPRAFGLLQLGYIGGTTIGVWAGGRMIMATANWDKTAVFGLHIHGWQWILIWIGIPSFLVAIAFLLIKEPVRRVEAAERVVVPEKVGLARTFLTFIGWDAFKAIRFKGAVYYPLFLGLALSATESQGLTFWRTPFMLRTYGWDEGMVGNVLAPMLLVAQLVGLVIGGILVERLGRKYKDANVRAAAICFTFTTVFTLAMPLMPTGELAAAAAALGTLSGIAGAPAQNAAIQRVAPQSMRGQVTALYLFMFTFFGAMGSFVIGSVAQRIVGDPQKLWLAIMITAGVLLPIATILMWRACKPYREEIERLEAAEAEAAAQS
ncbi:MAG TPA: MFS transporter [Sphingobium sp.]|nr:MFS transporter [Sphingobium sp.]